MIEIYTDGACKGNPGPGGWAAIVVEGESIREISGWSDDTTNNRMEIKAVIKGLETIPDHSNVSVFSDSTYVVNTMTRNWKRKANHDLWSQLDKLVETRKMDWHWVRGHNGHPMNERADTLATREANRVNPENNRLSHINKAGKAQMVDVGPKPATDRIAEATGSVIMSTETLILIQSNGFDKGDVLGIARIAGIMGAKNTASLIPLCHPLSIDHVEIEFNLNEQENTVGIKSIAKTTSKTGVEMEALTAVTIAALTIYDMCKSSDKRMRISDIHLLKKSGGEGGDIILD